MRYCCDMMRSHAESVCEDHPNRFACPDCLIAVRGAGPKYGIIVHDGGESVIAIQFCPWCGTRLPPARTRPRV
jgi:hypothetical protein